LALVGLSIVESIEVTDGDSAVAAAHRVGYPVVLKVEDPQVLHKTEIGGVFLGLSNDEEVRDALQRLKALTARSTSALLQSQIPGGLEMIVGLQTHETLGTFVLLGVGGVWTEVLDEVVTRPVGLRSGEGLEMIGDLKRQSAVLRRTAGAPPFDEQALALAVESIARLGQMAGQYIESLDVNPIMVLPIGAYVVDGLLVPNRQRHESAMNP
jgi:hypothetical protein